MLEGDEYEDHLLGDPNHLDDIIEARDLNQREEDEDNLEGDTGDQEQDDGDDKKDKPKRTRVLNPQPKLDAIRLTGPRGIAIVENLFRDFKFHGHSHEDEDLNRIMKRLELWGNRLFPKFQFDDLLEKVEKLGHKRPVLNFVHKIRMGIVTEDSVAENPEEENGVMEVDEPDLNGGSFSNTVHTDDAFDQLLEEQISQINTQRSQNSISPAKIQATITDEQKERMMRSRLLAEERRLARIKAQQEKNLVNALSSIVSRIETSSDIDVTVERAIESSPFNGHSEIFEEAEIGKIQAMERHETSHSVLVNIAEPSPILDNIDIGHNENKPEDVEDQKVEKVTESSESCGIVECVPDIDNHHYLGNTEDVELNKVDQLIENNEINPNVDKTMLLDSSEPAGEKLVPISTVGEEMEFV